MENSISRRLDAGIEQTEAGVELLTRRRGGDRNCWEDAGADLVPACHQDHEWVTARSQGIKILKSVVAETPGSAD